MNQPRPSSSQTAWLPVSKEDMITLPKEWKDRLGIENGMLVKAILREKFLPLCIVSPREVLGEIRALGYMTGLGKL
jgi:bifunctional DNA-binding transcriptional regulator/antitoxin component of YhaV-PrlF toxin-antitoxin module